MAKKVTLKIEPGLLSNLTTEFGTDDIYRLIEELYKDRAAILADNADLRADLAQIREASAWLGEASGVAAAERDHARATIAELVKLWDSYEMTAALPFDVRERAEAQALDLESELEQMRIVGKVVVADALQAREWARAWKRAAKGRRAGDKILLDDLVRLRTERDEWRQAAEEAQDAQFRYRDADVSALVRAAEALTEDIETAEAWIYDQVVPRSGTLHDSDLHALNLHRESALRSLADAKDALRPFRVVRAPLVGELSAETTLADWEAWRESIAGRRW